MGSGPHAECHAACTCVCDRRGVPVRHGYLRNSCQPFCYRRLTLVCDSTLSRADGCLQGGKAAGQAVLSMRQTGDFSKLSTRQYERRWMELFGHDFVLVSSLLCVKASGTS